DLEARELPGQFGSLVGSANQLLCSRVQRGIAQPGLVFDHQLESADGAQPVYRGWREDSRESFLNRREFLVERQQNRAALQILAFPLLERLEAENDDPGVRLRTERAAGNAGKLDGVLEA